MRRKGGDGRRRSGARWNAAARHRILGTAAGFGILQSSRSTSVRACLSVACDRLSWLPVTELAGSCLLFSIMAIHPLSGSGCEHGQEADRVYDEVRRYQRNKNFNFLTTLAYAPPRVDFGGVQPSTPYTESIILPRQAQD
jgi:hypothetical protein